MSRRGRGASVLVTLVAIAMTAACGSVAAQSPALPTALPTTSLDDIGETAPMTEPRDCRRITDFDADDSAGWFIVNDGVMGGRSSGGGEIDDSVLRFAGNVVTAGGGFTSVRLRLAGDELVDTTRIEMRVRPDDRTYGLTMEDATVYRGIPVSHRADLARGPVDSDGWAIAAVDYDRLVPSVFGVLLEAPPFDPASAREIGIIIADGIDGDFALEVDWIDACP
jgi:hypothetical protein